MGISSTTKIECDFIKDGKKCPKTFYLPDDPAANTPGVEDTVSLTIAKLKKTFYFCSLPHLLGFGLAYLKADDKSVFQAPEISVPTESDDLTLKDDA